MSVKTKIILSAVGVVTVVAITLSVLIFSLGNNVPEHLDPEASTPEQVVAEYVAQTEETWSGFERLDSSLTPSALLYSIDSRDYSFPLAHMVAFVGARPSSLSFDAIQESAAKAVKRIDFKEVSRDGSQATYENVNKICQVRDISVDDRSMYSFGCEEKPIVLAWAELTDRLLSLYRSAEPDAAVPSGTVRMRLTETKLNDNMSYATLSFEAEAVGEGQRYPRLLYGSLNGEWEYVANLSNPTVPSDGRRSVSEADLARMNDEKWQGALTDVY